MGDACPASNRVTVQVIDTAKRHQMAAAAGRGCLSWGAGDSRRLRERGRGLRANKTVRR